MVVHEGQHWNCNTCHNWNRQRILDQATEIAQLRKVDPDVDATTVSLPQPTDGEDPLEIGEGCRDIGMCSTNGYPAEDWCLPCRATKYYADSLQAKAGV